MTFFKVEKEHFTRERGWTLNVNQQIFNLNKQQQDFFKSLLKKHNVQTVLDISRGHKELAFLLAKWGKDVTALEKDAFLAREIHQQSIQTGINLKVLAGDMRDLSSVYRTRCDLITCMNNSLPRLLNKEDVWGTLAQMYLKLYAGGLLVIHTLDYDRLMLKDGEKICLWEGMLKGKKAHLYFKHGLEEGTAGLFYTFSPPGRTAREQEECQEMVNPIPKKELNMWLAELGFEKIENHDWARHDGQDNYFLVTVASRPKTIYS